MGGHGQAQRFGQRASVRLSGFCHFLIQLHQPGHAGSLVGFPHGHAVGGHDGAVVGLMGLPQLRRHGQLVVQVRQAAVRVQRPGVQDGLRRLFDARPLLVGGIGPGEVVVDNLY